MKPIYFVFLFLFFAPNGLLAQPDPVPTPALVYFDPSGEPRLEAIERGLSFLFERAKISVERRMRFTADLLTNAKNRDGFRSLIDQMIATQEKIGATGRAETLKNLDLMTAILAARAPSSGHSWDLSEVFWTPDVEWYVVKFFPFALANPEYVPDYVLKAFWKISNPLIDSTQANNFTVMRRAIEARSWSESQYLAFGYFLAHRWESWTGSDFISERLGLFYNDTGKLITLEEAVGRNMPFFEAHPALRSKWRDFNKFKWTENGTSWVGRRGSYVDGSFIDHHFDNWIIEIFPDGQYTMKMEMVERSFQVIDVLKALTWASSEVQKTFGSNMRLQNKSSGNARRYEIDRSSDQIPLDLILANLSGAFDGNKCSRDLTPGQVWDHAKLEEARARSEF